MGLTLQQLMAKYGLGQNDNAGVSIGNMKMPSAEVLTSVYGVPANVAKLFANRPITYSSGGMVKPISTGSGFESGLLAIRNMLLGSEVAKRAGVTDAQLKTGYNAFLTALKIPTGNAPVNAYVDALRTYSTVGGDWTKVSLSTDTLYNPAKEAVLFGGGTNSPSAAALSGATANEQVSAYDSVMNTLQQWGLDTNTDLINRVKGMIITNANTPSLVNPDAVLNQIRESDAYKQAFPGLTERNNNPNIPGAEHMTEQQYMTWMASVQGTAQQYGLPNLTTAEITSLVKGNVSAAEFNQRVIQGYAAAANADPAVKAQLANYGINTHDLAHYYLDPKNSITKLEQQTAAATLAGYSREIGLQGLSREGTIELADRANLGAASGQSGMGTQSMASIQNALLAASKDNALNSTTPGANKSTVDANTIIGAQVAGFQGTNQVEAQTRVMRAEQAKGAPFEKGGGYLETSKGVIGIGSART